MAPLMRIQLAETGLLETLVMPRGIAAAESTAKARLLARRTPMTAKINALFLFMFNHLLFSQEAVVRSK